MLWLRHRLRDRLSMRPRYYVYGRVGLRLRLWIRLRLRLRLRLRFMFRLRLFNLTES